MTTEYKIVAVAMVKIAVHIAMPKTDGGFGLNT
jgi:hypothetical protein